MTKITEVAAAVIEKPGEPSSSHSVPRGKALPAPATGNFPAARSSRAKMHAPRSHASSRKSWTSPSRSRRRGSRASMPIRTRLCGCISFASQRGKASHGPLKTRRFAGNAWARPVMCYADAARQCAGAGGARAAFHDDRVPCARDGRGRAGSRRLPSARLMRRSWCRSARRMRTRSRCSTSCREPWRMRCRSDRASWSIARRAIFRNATACTSRRRR